MSTPVYYRVLSRNLWGDYGHALIAGFVSAGRTRGSIERTGPFVPPISVSGLSDVVATEEARQRLREHCGSSVGFLPLKKDKIVRLDWHAWDLSSAEPLVYPKGHDPFNYLEKGEDSVQLKKSMPKLWLIKPPPVAEVKFIARHLQISKCQIRPPENPEIQVFSGLNGNFVFVTEKAISWFVDISGEWLSFEECEIL